MIQIIGPPLSQWDTGRSIEASGSTATHAHFANRGDSYAVIMELVDGKTKIPDYLLQTNKDLFIYLVLDGVTQESKTFSVRKREKPENYIYEDDQRNYIYKLTDRVEAATQAANQTAHALHEAKENGEFNGKDGTRVSVSTRPIQGDPHDPNLSGTVLAIATFDPNTGSATDTYISIFNGKDGKTPARGTDYWTDADKTEMVNEVLAALPDGDEVTY